MFYYVIVRICNYINPLPKNISAKIPHAMGVIVTLLAHVLLCNKGLFTYYVIIFLNSQTEFCDRRSPQLVVAIGHNIFEVTATPICSQRPPQFLVPEGHKIH